MRIFSLLVLSVCVLIPSCLGWSFSHGQFTTSSLHQRRVSSKFLLVGSDDVDAGAPLSKHLHHPFQLHRLSTSSSPSLSSSPLCDFHLLMGKLYGVAGLAHFTDLLFGQSTILTMAGAPKLSDLPLLGQFYALVWCVSGLVAAITSRNENWALAGIAIYGIVEVVGATILLASFDTVGGWTVVNAVLVQIAVAMAWVYALQKEKISAL